MLNTSDAVLQLSTKDSKCDNEIPEKRKTKASGIGSKSEDKNSRVKVLINIMATKEKKARRCSSRSNSKEREKYSIKRDKETANKRTSHGNAEGLSREI